MAPCCLGFSLPSRTRAPNLSFAHNSHSEPDSSQTHGRYLNSRQLLLELTEIELFRHERCRHSLLALFALRLLDPGKSRGDGDISSSCKKVTSTLLGNFAGKKFLRKKKKQAQACKRFALGRRVLLASSGRSRGQALLLHHSGVTGRLQMPSTCTRWGRSPFGELSPSSCSGSTMLGCTHRSCRARNQESSQIYHAPRASWGCGSSERGERRF